MANEFSHYNTDGTAKMVDISGKAVTSRFARASGFVRMQKKTLDMIENEIMPKGNVFEVAKIAGVMAAKKTSDLIPMCHPLALTHVDLEVNINDDKTGVYIEGEARLEGKTGVEMEALTAVSVAALTVYDMCKAVDKEMVIEYVKLLEKKGGKSG